MTKRQTFLMCVYSGAVAEDMKNQTNNSRLIAEMATLVPEEKIPACPINAAAVFLAYCNGRTDRPHKWMF